MFRVNFDINFYGCKNKWVSRKTFKYMCHLFAVREWKCHGYSYIYENVVLHWKIRTALWNHIFNDWLYTIYRKVYIYILYVLKKFNLQAYKISDIWLPAEGITHSNLEDNTFVFYNGNSHKKEHSVFCLLHGKKSSTPTHSSDVFFKHAFYLKTDGMTSAIVVVSSMIAIHSLSWML